MIFNIQNQLSEEKLQFSHLFSGYSRFGNENLDLDEGLLLLLLLLHYMNGFLTPPPHYVTHKTLL